MSKTPRGVSKPPHSFRCTLRNGKTETLCCHEGKIPVVRDCPALRAAFRSARIRPANEKTDKRLIRLWDEAEAIEPTMDGYHFVPCPQCERRPL